MKKLDFHVHFQNHNLTAKDSADYFTEMCKRYGYEGVGIMAIYHRPGKSGGADAQCNQKALQIKALMKNSYAFASPLPNEDFAVQAKKFMEQGFDGIKLIRGGKPNVQKMFGHFYDDEVYAEFFDYCQEHQVPLMIHNNDPLIHWDIANAPQRAIDNGWVYDESFPSQEEYFRHLEAVLERYPRLNAAIAHLGFYSDNLDRAISLLERYPNLKFDITPAIIIYEQLSKTPQKTEEFFRRYHERLIFGTDADSDFTHDGERGLYTKRKNAITSAFFSGTEPREVGQVWIHPIHLEPQMLENIYYNNAIRWMKQKC